MKNPSIKTLKKKLDKIFSEYIRKRDKGVCFTSDVKKHWKEQQAGHFYSRVHHGTRYDERNVHCQTLRDNVFLKGNMIVYYQRMMALYGQVEMLDQQKSWTVVEFVWWILMRHSTVDEPQITTREAYLYLIEHYSSKLKEL